MKSDLLWRGLRRAAAQSSCNSMFMSLHWITEVVVAAQVFIASTMAPVKEYGGNASCMQQHFLEHALDLTAHGQLPLYACCDLGKG